MELGDNAKKLIGKIEKALSERFSEIQSKVWSGVRTGR